MKKYLIPIVVVVALSLYIYLSMGNSYINMSSTEPVIKTTGTVFDISPDECIATLNKDIKSEGLKPIPNGYEIAERNGYTVYKVLLSDNIMFRMVIYDEEGKGVARIGLSILDSFVYVKGDNKINKTISKDEKKMAQKYYTIICHNVRPNFNAKPFMKSVEIGTSDFTLDGIVFLSNMPTFGWHPSSGIGGKGSDGSEDITLYEVISDKSIYNKHNNEILGGNDDFFIYFKEFRKLNSI